MSPSQRFRPKEEISERAIFVIDNQGKIAWSKRYDIAEQPTDTEVHAVLQQLR